MGPYDDLGFTFAVRQSGEVTIRRDGRVVTVLRGAAAARFLTDAGAGDAQQVMARATGNYRRGNERTASRHERNRGSGPG